MSGIRPIRLQTIKKEYIWGTEDWLLSYLHEECKDVPLLIKKIVAKDALSVQVHPNDTYAKEKEGCSGKTEMWYVLDCEPGAYLYYGLKHKISANEFLKRIQNGTITEVCKKVFVKKGDVFYIPAGLVHAIGAGITVAEIQQSSNITYRVYDYQRTDANHQPRQLHIEQAAEVAGFVPPIQGHHPMGLPVKLEGCTKTLLVQCPYFAVHHLEIGERYEKAELKKPAALFVTGGEGMLFAGDEEFSLKTGDCIYLPKETKKFTITGKLEILMSEAPL